MAAPIPLLYNPAAGGGRGAVRFREIEALLAVKNLEIEAIETQHAGHAIELAEDLARAGKKRIFALGGDGTQSEVANGVLRSGKQPALGFIPAGTGNDFLRDFAVKDRADAVRRIAQDKPRAIDAVRVSFQQDGEETDHYSINIFGIGFAAQAADMTNRRFKWARGQAYNLGILAQLTKLKPTVTRLVLDGEEETGDYPMVMACNTVHTGGAMKMAPMALPDDGCFDVLTAESVNRRELLGLLAKVRTGGHVGHPKVRFRTAKTLELEPQDPSPMLVDGEVLGQTPARLEMMPGALRILV